MDKILSNIASLSKGLDSKKTMAAEAVSERIKEITKVLIESGYRKETSVAYGEYDERDEYDQVIANFYCVVGWSSDQRIVYAFSEEIDCGSRMCTWDSLLGKDRDTRIGSVEGLNKLVERIEEELKKDNKYYDNLIGGKNESK